jgi:hypothetical protein
MIKGSIESADFNALKFQRKKNLDHNEWYKYLQSAVKDLLGFVMENHPMGLMWAASGVDKWADLISGSPPQQQNIPA